MRRCTICVPALFFTACSPPPQSFPPGVVGILHLDKGTDYVFRGAPSTVGGRCDGWNEVAVQKAGQDSTAITSLMCWKETNGMLRTATARSETPKQFRMKSIITSD
jgi:hypothetical protein